MQKNFQNKGKWRTGAAGLIMLVLTSGLPAQSQPGSGIATGAFGDLNDPLEQADVQLDLLTGEEERESESATEQPFIPEQLIPEPEKPLETIEDYQARIAQITAVAEEMSEKAARVNHTAALWKQAFEDMEEKARALTQELEDVKSRNRQLIIENGELRSKTEQLRTVNLDNPIINITEKDLDLKPKRESIIQNGPSLTPAPTQVRPQANAAPAPTPAPAPGRVELPPVPRQQVDPPRGQRVPVPQGPDPFPANDGSAQGKGQWVWDPATGTLHRVEQN